MWTEVGALALFLGGLVFLIIAGLQSMPFVVNKLLTGTDQIVVRGIAFGWKEQAVAVAAFAMPGLFLIIVASTLRFWLGGEEWQAEQPSTLNVFCGSGACGAGSITVPLESGDTVMRLNEASFAGPADRQILGEIITEVLHEVGPDEVAVTSVFIDPLLEELFQGQMVAFDTREEAGSFGGADWLVVTLVPLVADSVGLLRQRLAVLEASGGPIPETLISELSTPAKVEEMARRVNSLYARKRATALARALHASLTVRLEHLRGGSRLTRP